METTGRNEKSPVRGVCLGGLKERKCLIAVEIRVLGAVELIADGQPIRLALQQRRLLAALTTHAKAERSVDVLIEALWGERPPSSAAKVLQVYVSRLRKALPASARIGTRGAGYALELGDGSLDAVRFERLLDEGREAMRSGNPSLAASLLRRALALWRGPAYGEFAYEEFARAEAERLEELYLVALEERIEAELALGRHAALLPELRSLAIEHPSRERLQAHAMLALYRCQRQSEALEFYTVIRTRLREELGLEPGAELRELQRRILQHDAGLALHTSPQSPRSTLPSPPNRLLGRERELPEVGELLRREDVRLLVLTGAGGSGKTRLALEAAREAAPSFANGAAFIDLAPLRDPEHVPGAIARALGIQDLTDERLETLAAALRPLELLLLLDNAEHLTAAGPGFVELLACAPRLTLLVTSRVVLHLSGEHVYPVRPLGDDGAVALFYERVRDAAPRFHPAGADEQAIRRICSRLDGLPLAIELVASRIRILTPPELLERLDPSLPLLTAGPRDLPARQQTLRDTLEWSLDLLDQQVQRDLYRLGVFVGGCDLQAAQAVTDTTIDRLTALVDHSLLQHTSAAGGSRYTMLETIHEHARDRLSQLDEAAAVERRHAEHILEMGEAADAALGADREIELQRLRPELDNLRAAMRWALETDTEIALRLGWVAALFQPPTNELRHWLDEGLALRDNVTTFTRARALHASASATSNAGEYERSGELFEQALVLYREAGSEPGVARGLAGLALAASQRGEQPTARDLYATSLDLYRKLGDSEGEWLVTTNLGELELASGNYERATELLERAVAVATANGDLEAAAMSLHGLGDVALGQGEIALSAERYREAISLSRELAGGRRNTCSCLAGLASVAGERRQVERAGLLWGAVESLEEQLGATLPLPNRRRYWESIDELASHELESAIGRGRTLPSDEAVTYALSSD
jgi:predicted ATPase/DNA-binding SARP family transcriptional activator